MSLETMLNVTQLVKMDGLLTETGCVKPVHQTAMLVRHPQSAAHARLLISSETMASVTQVVKMDGLILEVGFVLNVMDPVLLALQRSTISVLRVPLGYRK